MNAPFYPGKHLALSSVQYTFEKHMTFSKIDGWWCDCDAPDNHNNGALYPSDAVTEYDKGYKAGWEDRDQE